MNQQQTSQPATTAATAPQASTTDIKWRTILGLLLVIGAVLLNSNALWGIVTLLWVIPDLKSGSTQLFQTIERKSEPFLYWFICITWLVLGIYFLVLDFL